MSNFNSEDIVILLIKGKLVELLFVKILSILIVKLIILMYILIEIFS